MHTNLEYENANTAIWLIKNGMNLIDAVNQANAKNEIVNMMLGNEDVITEDVFVEDLVRIQRENVCSTCNKNKNNVCMECACPLPAIINMNFKDCPLGKW